MNQEQLNKHPEPSIGRRIGGFVLLVVLIPAVFSIFDCVSDRFDYSRVFFAVLGVAAWGFFALILRNQEIAASYERTQVRHKKLVIAAIVLGIALTFVVESQIE